jgi:hypothetical protein
MTPTDKTAADVPPDRVERAARELSWLRSVEGLRALLEEAKEERFTYSGHRFEGSVIAVVVDRVACAICDAEALIEQLAPKMALAEMTREAEDDREEQEAA